MNTRGYFAWAHNVPSGIAIVAHSVAEAKKIAFATGELKCSWLEMRCRWFRDADVAGLPVGFVEDPVTASQAKLCWYLEEFPCDECGLDKELRDYHGKALCQECIKKEAIL